MKTKIAIIEPVGGHGGNEFYLFNLGKIIKSTGHDVYLYTCNETKLEEKTAINFKIEKTFGDIWKSKSAFVKLLRHFNGVVKTIISIKRNKIGIAHFHIFGISQLQFWTIKLFRFLNIKILCTIHDVESFEIEEGNTQLFFIQKFTENIDHIIVHTNFAKEILQNKIEEKYHAKISVIANCDTDFLYNQSPLNKLDACKKLDLPSDNLNLLFFGQIKEVKGVDILLKAFSLLLKDIPNINLTIAGKFWKTEEEQYSKLIDELHIKDHLTLRNNYIKNEDVPLYFYASDIIVLPYKRIYNSGVMLRALDYGGIIVCSDLAPFTETIINGYNGYTFINNDYKSLANKIKQISLEQQNITKIKNNIMQTLKSKFSHKDIARKMMEITTNLTDYDRSL